MMNNLNEISSFKSFIFTSMKKFSFPISYSEIAFGGTEVFEKIRGRLSINSVDNVIF